MGARDRPRDESRVGAQATPALTTLEINMLETVVNRLVDGLHDPALRREAIDKSAHPNQNLWSEEFRQLIPIQRLESAQVLRGRATKASCQVHQSRVSIQYASLLRLIWLVRPLVGYPVHGPRSKPPS